MLRISIPEIATSELGETQAKKANVLYAQNIKVQVAVGQYLLSIVKTSTF